MTCVRHNQTGRLVMGVNPWGASRPKPAKKLYPGAALPYDRLQAAAAATSSRIARQITDVV
jgi:hypothetical protein